MIYHLKLAVYAVGAWLIALVFVLLMPLFMLRQWIVKGWRP